MFSITQNLVYDVNRGKGQRTNHLHFNRCQFRTSPTCGSMPTFSDRCSRLADSTNTSSASQTPSPNTQWSRPWKTRRPRPWRKQFLQTGFVNSASQRRFTPMSSSRGVFPSDLHSYSKRRFIRPFAPPCYPWLSPLSLAGLGLS